jgi:secreted Zn-dependent insulinase-like peptidase
MQFRFKGKQRPDNYAVSLSDALSMPYPRDLVLKGAQVIWPWTDGEGPEEAKRLLDSLRVEESRTILMGRKEDHDRVAGTREWQSEPWYGTQYRVERYDEEFVQIANGPNLINSFALPRSNEFIPENLDVDRREVLEVSGPFSSRNPCLQCFVWIFTLFIASTASTSDSKNSFVGALVQKRRSILVSQVATSGRASKPHSQRFTICIGC